jgi:hypothetical protein
MLRDPLHRLVDRRVDRLERNELSRNAALVKLCGARVNFPLLRAKLFNGERDHSFEDSSPAPLNALVAVDDLGCQCFNVFVGQ